MSHPVRIALIVLGLLLVLGGVFAWTVEDESGSGLDFSTRPNDGQTAVYEAESGEEPVFVGSRDEAFEYMERQRAARESFVLPGVIIAVGAILGLAASVGRGRRGGRTVSTEHSS